MSSFVMSANASRNHGGTSWQAGIQRGIHNAELHNNVPHPPHDNSLAHRAYDDTDVPSKRKARTLRLVSIGGNGDDGGVTLPPPLEDATDQDGEHEEDLFVDTRRIQSHSAATPSASAFSTPARRYQVVPVDTEGQQVADGAGLRGRAGGDFPPVWSRKELQTQRGAEASPSSSPEKHGVLFSPGFKVFSPGSSKGSVTSDTSSVASPTKSQKWRNTSRKISASAKLQETTEVKAEEPWWKRTRQRMKRLKWTMTSGHEVHTAIRRSKPFLLNPKSAFFRFWDIVTLVLLLFTATVTPFEVAYLETDIASPLFWINRFVDMCFMVDLVFNLFLQVQDKDGMWINSRKEVAMRYVTSWFLIDVISIFPFDVIGVATDSDQATNLKVLRVVRLMRLAKLLRMLRAGRMFRRWESVFAINYALLTLFKFIVMILFLSHWMACAFFMILVLESGRPSTDTPAPGHPTWLSEYEFVAESAGVWSKYLASIYWSVATLATLGYGDLVPTTDVERSFAVVMTILGASVYAYIIGNVVGIVAGLLEQNSKFYAIMDALNAFMEEKKIPQELRERLREFFRFRHRTNQMSDWQGLLENMSPSLRAEVSRLSHSRWITSVACFRGCSREFISEMVMRLRTITYSVNEVVIRKGERAETMFIVEKGVVVLEGQAKVMTMGSIFGEDMIFRDIRRKYHATTVTHSLLMMLTRDAMVDLLNDFVPERRRLRKYVIKTVFRETVLAYARAVKKAEAEEARLANARQREQEKGASAERGAEELVEDVIPNTAADALTAAEHEMNPNMVRLMYAHRQNRMSIEEVTAMDRSVRFVQRRAAKFLSARRAARLEKDLTSAKTEAGYRSVRVVLDACGMAEHMATFRREELTLEVVAYDIEPLAIREVTGCKLGRAVRLVKAARELVRAREREELANDARANGFKEGVDLTSGLITGRNGAGELGGELGKAEIDGEIVPLPRTGSTGGSVERSSGNFSLAGSHERTSGRHNISNFSEFKSAGRVIPGIPVNMQPGLR